MYLCNISLYAIGVVDMAIAKWKEVVLAESDEIITIEGNLYFPPDSEDGEMRRPAPGLWKP